MKISRLRLMGFKSFVEKTEDFIRKNIAGQKTKQAQSRRKMLEKLERLAVQWQKSLPGAVGGHNTSRFAGAGQTRQVPRSG